MCDPVSLATAVAGGARAGGQVAQYEAQRSAARNARETINAQTAQNYKALAQRRTQEEAAIAQQTQATQRQARLAEGQQRTRAGARGVSGLSTEQLLANVRVQEARALDALRLNNRFQEQAFLNDQQSIQLQARSSLLAATRPAFPIFGLINTAASTAASGVNASNAQATAGYK